MKNQYFPPRALPKPPATFPELSGSAREPPMEPPKRSLEDPPSAPRAESGRPQNWSLAISGSPKRIKINEKSILSAQNPSKTSCNDPELPVSARKPRGAAEMLFGGLSSAQAPARAETGQPQNWSPKPLKINEKSIFAAQDPS